MAIALEGLELAVEFTRSFDGIRFVPVVSKRATSSTPIHRFFWEGMEDKSVEIEELPSSSVPTVTLKNKSDEFFLTYRGTIIRGGGQNRQIIHSFIIPSKKSIKIPVQCIQQGRWNPHRQRQFMSQSGEVTTPSMRFKTKHQSETWESITQTSTVTRSITPTSDFTAMKDVYLGSDQDYATASATITTSSFEERQEREQGRARAQAMLQALAEVVPGQIGVYVLMVDVEEYRQDKFKVMECMEIFANPELYKKIHREVVGSFVAEIAMLNKPVTEAIPEVTPALFQNFLEKLKKSNWVTSNSIGNEMRQEVPPNPNVFGESVLLGEEVMHLMYASY